MTNSQPHQPSRVLLPGVALLLFVAGPVLIGVGGYLGWKHADLTADWAISLARLGSVLFWVGIAALLSALILEGVRSVAQQQLQLMRNESGRD